MFNPFVLQTLFSSLPAVLVSGLIPVLAGGMGLDLLQIGFFFMLVRFGLVFGSGVAPIFLKRLPPHVMGVLIEVFNAIISIVILISVTWGIEESFVLSGFFKGIFSGGLLVLRFSWLRKMPDNHASSRINIITNALVQSGYGLVGVLILLAPSLQMAKTILTIDIVTSLFGALIFWSMKKYRVEPDVGQSKIKDWIGVFSKGVPRRFLTLGEWFLCLGMGGCNLMALKYGHELFGKANGYGIALVLYGSCFYLGGVLINRYYKNKELRPNLLVMGALSVLLGVCIFALPYLASLYSKMALFAFVFLLYPVIYLLFDGEWFRISDQKEASLIASGRMMYAQLLFGLGEVLYGWVLFDYPLRLALLFLAGVVLVVMSKYLDRNPKIWNQGQASEAESL